MIQGLKRYIWCIFFFSFGSFLSHSKSLELLEVVNKHHVQSLSLVRDLEEEFTRGKTNMQHQLLHFSDELLPNELNIRALVATTYSFLSHLRDHT